MKYPGIILGGLVICFFLMLQACKKEDENPPFEFPEYVGFGRFITPGCFNNEVCIELFKLDKSELREDVLDNQPEVGQAYVGDYETLLNDKDHDDIELLFRSSIPKSLLATESGMIGTSPAWNSNYFYFEYKTATTHRYWIIDGSFDGNLGPEMTNFINNINQAISLASF